MAELNYVNYCSEDSRNGIVQLSIALNFESRVVKVVAVK